MKRELKTFEKISANFFLARYPCAGDFKLGIGHFRILFCEEMIFPLPKEKND